MAGLTRSPVFSARLLRDHLVVVDVVRCELRVLNPSAAALWLWLDEDFHDVASLSAAMAELLPTTGPDVAADIASTLSEWGALGWLDCIDNRYRMTRQASDPVDPFRGRAQRYPPGTLLPTHRVVCEMSLSLDGRSCRVVLGTTGGDGFPDAIPRLRALLAGLAVAEPTGEGPELRLVNAGDHFWIGRPDAVFSTADESFALSSVAAGILHHTYVDAGLFATVHAAAVAQPTGTLLLPGVSGSGKSTLTAYLATHGWCYWGDDVVGLGRRQTDADVVVLPFPTALGLKPGSWPVLKSFYPEIETLPIVPYADRQARFLPLPSATGHDRGQRRVRAVVQPCYTAGRPTRLELMDPVTALCSLVQSGVTTGDLLDPMRVDALLEMLEQVPCYRLEYSNLAEAERRLRAVFA